MTMIVLFAAFTLPLWIVALVALVGSHLGGARLTLDSPAQERGEEEQPHRVARERRATVNA
jgi:hypothetical protein